MRRITILAALVACAALVVAGPAAAKPGKGPGGPGHGPRCAPDHDPVTAESVQGHVDAAYAAIDAFNAAVAVPDDEAAIAAMRTYGAESKLAICELKRLEGPPPSIDGLETLGDMHVAALTAFDAAYETASDELKRPLRRAIVHEKRSCEKVVRVLTRLAEGATPEDQARIAALVAEYEAACDAVEVPEGSRPDRPHRPDRPPHGPAGPGGEES